jgi:hypothetical protein
MSGIKMIKKAMFFSTDALVALILILLTVLILYPVIQTSGSDSEIQEDVVEVFSTLKVGEANDTYVKSLIAGGEIKDLNNSVLEQIGEFYITNKSLAVNMANAMLNYLYTGDNIGIWFEDDLITSSNKTPYENASNVVSSTHTVSGLSNIESNGSITGYSARAWLASSLSQKYFYFGGYDGDGNISLIINFSGTLNYVGLEVAVNKDFDIYINGNFSGHYENSSSEFAPSTYDLSAYNSSFMNGDNTIKLVAPDLYVAGGFFKVIYESFNGFEHPGRYYFPGIEGAVNLYDGFYVPGNLNELKVYLHLDSPYVVFMNIGNITVYNDSTSGEEIIEINNSNLSSLLDYSDLSQKTIPLRLGLENASYVIKGQKADAFSVTDVSGSMCGNCDGSGIGFGICCFLSGGCNNDQPVCEGCGGACEDMIFDAQDANKEFVDIVLNYSGSRAGLVAYESNVDENDCHSLSNDSSSLKNKVDEWEAVGGTCICCGINRAVDSLIANSSSNRSRSVVVMSDGAANVQCARQGNGSSSLDAIQAACDAYELYGIRVYSIGFGSGADESTLQSIAGCGNGTYSFADASSLVDVYKNVTDDMIEAAYQEQTIEATEGLLTVLYPDSYIEFNYTKASVPYGLLTVLEQQFHDGYYGDFIVSNNSQVIEARAVSYSGSRWTDNLEINNFSIYNLSYYGSDYTRLGDPYSVQIPVSYIGEYNTVRVTTGTSTSNSTSGSQHNKVIYTLRQNASSYSEIVALAEGCIWNLEFEDSSVSSLYVPADYSGSDNCNYKSTGINVSNDEDAVQLATLNLLSVLDYDNDGRIDVRFTEQNLEISSSRITGIPYIISTEVQVRRWS